MKKFFVVSCLVVLVTGFATLAHADLDGFLQRLNVEAQVDLGKYNVKLGAQFGVPVPEVDLLIKRVASPADAFMVLQLGNMTQKPPEAVVQTYTANRDKGWGAIAKELGIKPGSSEFHALKRGDFKFTGTRGGSEKGHGKGKGKGKKHDT